MSNEDDLATFTIRDAKTMARWCRDLNASVIGIDAPCRWSTTGRARLAERELAADGIHAFATPTRQRAENHSFYRWMLNGAELYSHIELTHQLFDKDNSGLDRVCFETFPHAVACALAGAIVSAKQKRIVRRTLLRHAAIDTTVLTNIDIIDAALCALTAKHVLTRSIKIYGDVREGFIIVPI